MRVSLFNKIVKLNSISRTGGKANNPVNCLPAPA